VHACVLCGTVKRKSLNGLSLKKLTVSLGGLPNDWGTLNQQLGFGLRGSLSLCYSWLHHYLENVRADWLRLMPLAQPAGPRWYGLPLPSIGNRKAVQAAPISILNGRRLRCGECRHVGNCLYWDDRYVVLFFCPISLATSQYRYLL